MIMDSNLIKMIGQKFILGLDVNNVTPAVIKAIKTFKIGGVILYKKNYSDYQSMINLIKKLKSLNQSNPHPLFIAVDQEGGRVNRLSKPILNIPAAYKITKTGQIKNAIEAAQITGEILVQSGFNMNFAPVLDIKRFDDNHAIGDRSFGPDIQTISKYGLPYFKELNKHLISVVKHFPGHGKVNQDSHFILPTARKYADFQTDLIPFERAIRNGCDAIMVGHLLIKDINQFYPIAFSKNFLKPNLRQLYQFKGLIITDQIKMRALYFRYNIFHLIKRAFENDVDIVLMKFKPQDLKKFTKLIKLYHANQLNQSQLKESYQRIIQIKEKYQINDNLNFNGIDITTYNNRIAKLRNKIK